MHTFRHSSAESRLCRLTIDELNKKLAAVGAVAAIPLNKRAAEANAAVQNQPTKNTGSAVTDPAAASMQRLRDTQAYLAENPSVDPTGSIGKQALEGQALAETYVAPRNIGNEQYYKDQANFLQDYTATKSNAADGFASSIDQGVSEVKDPITGEIKYVRTQGNVQTASMSQIQQSAIENLRKAGKTDEEIKATLDDPTYLQNIAQTMSNTGLGGTARQSAVLTPAQAQSVLATSRNPNERKAAQDALDAAATQGVSQTVEKQVGTDKNGNPIYMTQTNPNYEAEVEAKRQRMAQEQANKLKVQESEKKMKEFTAGVDTTALTETQKQISGIMESIKGLSPALQSAVLPNLLSLQQSNNEALTMAQTMVNSLPTDQEIEAQYGTMEKYILSQGSKYEDLLKKNKDTQIEVAEYNKEMLEIDKKILEHDADVSEQKQAQANIENEKRLRRQLNKLGIQTDVQGLSFLNSEIQKGVDALENMKTANNLVSLKANLAISKGYSLEVKGILNDYEGKYLEITSKTTEALNSVRSSISKDKSERDKEMRSILEKASEKKAENDKEARSMIYNANVKMIDEVGKARDDERAQEQLAWNILDDAVARYGSLVPKSTIDRVSAMLPAGTDIRDYINTPTIAERNSKRISGSGGVSGVGGVSSAAGSVAAAVYGDVTPQQLKEAVARAFAPANYGGTEGERAKRQNEYLSRINSGEAPSTIMESLARDYWSSQKGAPRNAHDGRTEAQASAESLQSYVDHYGIASGDDGALGAIDSRVQAMLSVFDKSSEEYNNLATNVGNIRARIIKENYGAAVTPQELEIAKSYIPDMTDKGGVFATKLQNLKSYQAYLDAKVSASNLGLPAPKPPTPVTLSGDKMSGPAKYSATDITSALSE